jgi:hypothetical protein
VHGGFETRHELAHTLRQSLVVQHVEHRQRCRARQRVTRAGVAVHQLGQVRRALHQRVVDLARGDHAAERRRTVAHRLGEDDHVRHHAEGLRREHRAQAAEAGDDLVEDQQQAMPVADRAQAFEVTPWRHQHAGGAGHGLDDHGSDVARIVQGDQALQLVGHRFATLGRLPAHEGLRRRIPGALQMVGTQHRAAEHASVVGHAADADAAETRAVKGALAADEERALALAERARMGERDLQRRVVGLGFGPAHHQ